MTLIALTLNHGYPVMVGDILVSSTDAKEAIRTPTFVHGTGDILKSLSGSRPDTFRRKLYVINKNMCVGLAGSVNQMRRFLNQLFVFFRDQAPSEEEWIRYSNVYPAEDRTDLSGIVLIAHTKGDQVKYFTEILGAGLEYKGHHVFETAIACGSGATSFLGAAERMVAYDGARMDLRDLTRNRALHENLILLSNCLAYETISANTLLERWGAGFEIIVYDPEVGFSLLKEFTVILFYGEYAKGEDSFARTPIRVMKFAYEGDNLVIRVTSERVERFFCAIPITKDEIPNEGKIFPYDSRNTLLTYLIKDKSLHSTFYTPSVACFDDSQAIVIELDGNQMKLMIDSRLQDVVLEYLKNVTK